MKTNYVELYSNGYCFEILRGTFYLQALLHRRGIATQFADCTRFWLPSPLERGWG